MVVIEKQYIGIKNRQTKARGLQRVMKIFKLSKENVMAMGDNYNDIEMIAGAGVGVAVANAPEAVLRAATLRTTLPSGTM